MTAPLSKPSLSRLLRPRTVLVAGGRWAEAVVQQLDLIGFPGEVWVLNPTRQEIAGRACIRSLEELPAAPDAAFLAVPAEDVIEMVTWLSAKGAGGAVCFASGFSELGEVGRDRQDRLLAAVGDMPVIGPNCYGVINYLDRVPLWPDQHGGKPVERGAAIISQSGNMALNLTMQQRGLPLAFTATLGNQAMIGITEMIETLLEDERITAIGLHMEGLGDVAAFERAVLKAREKKVPIVALKAGRSQTAARIALSHTASLTGQDALFDAFFQRLGVARVSDVPEFLELLKFLSIAGPLPGNKIGSLSCSGGEAGLVADLAEGRELDFPQPDADQAAAIQATLNEYVSISNPIDYHTFVWGKEGQLTAVFTAMMQVGYDATMLILDFPRKDRCDASEWWKSVRAMGHAAKTSGKIGCIVSSMAENLQEAEAEQVAAEGLVPLQGLSSALTVLEAAAKLGRAQTRPAPAPLLPVREGTGPIRQLDEWKAKRLLERQGLAVPQGALAVSPSEAAEAARHLGGAVAVKAVSDTLAHKTEAGGVRLNLTDPQEIEEAANHMLGLCGRVLVERMVEAPVAELIIGIDRDPQFGLYLVIGAGGILVELERDVCSLLLPVTEDEVREGLESLRCYPLLTGFRGRPRGDIDAVVQAVLAVARFAETHADQLEEVDINPLMVLKQGQGAIAADALIRLREES